jgi:glycosyltransferase involved in cell wall biosynthesis
MNALVSIIVPVYNREELIEKTLHSIKKQSYVNWECILVDDGSYDNTVKIIKEIIEKDSRFRLIQRPLSYIKGANSCRNIGFQASKGDYVNWFDSDDIMHEDFISTKLIAFKNDNTVDLVLSKTVKVSKDGKVYEDRTHLTNNLLEDYITRKVSWYLPDGMFKRAFLDEKICFDEDLKGGQDNDFYIKALIEKPKVRVIDFYATFYIIHEDSISNTFYRGGLSEQYYVYNFSHFNSLINHVNLLKKDGLLSKRLKKHYFLAIKKKLPCVFYMKKMKTVFYKYLFELSSPDIFYMKEFCKIFLASISFLLIRKGEKLLK